MARSSTTWTNKSGNPGGRPRSDPQVLQRLREATGNGWELFEQALKVVRGQLETTVVNNAGEFVTSPPTLKDQAEARNFLANRLWGTPAQESTTLQDVSLAELEAEIDRRLLGAAPAGGAEAPAGGVSPANRRIQ